MTKLELIQREILAYEAATKSANENLNTQERIIALQDVIADRQRLINSLKVDEANLDDDELALLKELSDKQKESIDAIRLENKLIKDQNDLLKKNLDIAKSILNELKGGWNYLMLQDKVIKSTILNLGMSGAKANEMRLSFEKSIQAVSMLGGNIEDIGKIQSGFADETGRARVLSEEMLIDIEKIGRGTGLGVENATKLAAQFEFMGVDVKNTMNWVQGVVDTSERMGVNTSKVLKNVSDNFRKLGTFSFKNGVKAFGTMAIDAEKTRVSMSTALNIADAKRNLEEVIELSANLQVMGGEFAKMDPFQWLYMVRNEPEKLNDEISKMTTGMFTLKKNSDGLFEKFISPADADRLRNVAKSLGISNEEMFEIAQRRLDINTLSKQLNGLGLSDKEKKTIEGAAILDEATGRYRVSLAGSMVDINNLTKTQAESFVQEQKVLEDRAKEAQTFNEVLINTINSLKGAFLPMLRSINYVLDKVVRPIAEFFGKSGLAFAALTLISAGLLWKVLIPQMVKNFVLTGNLMKNGAAGGVRGFFGGGGAIGATSSNNINSNIIPTPNNNGTAAAGANAGKGLMRGGIGVGAAAVGIGAGIGIAAVGISKLADSMAKLDKTGINALPGVISSLAVAFLPFAIALAIVGSTADVVWEGLLAVGAASLLIGAGIGVAAWGIGKMSEGLGTLVEKSKGAGADFLDVSLGIAAIAASIATFSNPLTGLGMLAFSAAMVGIIGASAASAHVADSMTAMGVAIKGSKDDFIAVQNAIESISKAKINSGGLFSELANLLKTPLKVEFADKTVSLNNNVTLNIDGSKFMNQVYSTKVALEQHNRLKSGVGGQAHNPKT